jgi:hypothetical protein
VDGLRGVTGAVFGERCLTLCSRASSGCMRRSFHAMTHSRDSSISPSMHAIDAGTICTSTLYKPPPFLPHLHLSLQFSAVPSAVSGTAPLRASSVCASDASQCIRQSC